ncbi:hypothetical protein, partial [Escherichia coli]|uniref:hypothetical protein n=1 Tax=Escherichia coli TaxID=562 RepID=UPI000A3EBE3E
MTLNLSGTTNNLLLQLLILVYFLLLIKQCYYLLCELLKNMALNGLGIAWLPLWSIADELNT